MPFIFYGKHCWMDNTSEFSLTGDFSSQVGMSDASLPIARRQLHDELLDRLRDLIISCELAPDSKIPEKELCERFGVSRTPLREALKVLAYDGLVVLQPNRGATVSALTIADLQEVFPIYSRLEALAGELSCTNCSDAEIAEIRALHEEMIEHYKTRSRRRHFELNELIHERIHAGAGNPTLFAMLRSMSCRIRRARIYANVTEERWADAIREHEEIIAALQARQGERLAALLRTHMENTFDSIKHGLSARNPS
jgi:DNA-binding GntR family transcriptional regulator